ncbi:MAG: polysaccharide deacetylase family protein [Planctomycetota bacterium]|jgi:hypothetical protein
MDRCFCVTIDVEPDCTVKWRRSDPLTFVNIETGIAEILHPLFERYGVKPTYLISPEVLNHKQSVEILKGLKNCEMGAHLHSEYIGPELKHENPAGSRSNEFPCNLPDQSEQAKIKSITELFSQCFGYPPKSYRAARFGADSDTLKWLAQSGYNVDTSVTPHINWQSKGGPDFREYPDQPYWIEKGKLLEIPATVAGKRFPLLPDKWFCYKWLRPSIMSCYEMKRLIDKFTAKNPDSIVLNMMFHSMEIIPNASPYVRTQRGQKRFLKKLKNVFEYLKNLNFEGKTLIEVYYGRA